MTHFVNQLYNDKLKNVIEFMNLVDTRCEVVQCTLLIKGNKKYLSLSSDSAPHTTYPVHVDEHHESISLTRSILFSFEVAVDELRSVRDQTVKVPVQTIIDDFMNPTHTTKNIAHITH